MSTLNLENIKHPDSASNNISVDSSGNTSTTGNTTVGGTSVSTSNGAVGRLFGVKSTQNNVVTGETSGGYGLILESRNTGRAGSERIAQINMSADGSGDGYLGFYTSPSGSDVVSRMNIDSAGRVTMPYQPSFYAYVTAGNPAISSGVYTTPNAQVVHNIGNHFDTATYTFTAPVSGTYQFNTAIAVDTNSSVFGYLSSELLVNNSQRHIGGWDSKGSTSGYINAKTAFTLYLSANDTVKHRYEVSTAATMVSNLGQTFFSGYLLG